ncbi:MAG: DUF4399 domain-containing protein [Thiobacillus sp.]|nr:DUF4399 domain-containing protein [Thiobacillus sp.]
MRTATRWSTWIGVLALMASVTATAQEPSKKVPEEVRLYFISPENGAKLKSPVAVRFGLAGMGVAPAGVARGKTGHHHVLIDTDARTLDMSKPLPSSDRVKHFGGGQTEATLDLAPGRHTLQLVLGDENHVPFDPPLMSEKITITVQ